MSAKTLGPTDVPSLDENGKGQSQAGRTYVNMSVIVKMMSIITRVYVYVWLCVEV